MKSTTLTGILLAAIIPVTDAQAAVTISTKPTAKMTCSGGVCSPTATNAVLNAGDLETLLASGNVMVTTTGANAQANDIRVEAPFAWSSTSALSLVAYESVLIYQPISVTGAGGVSLAPAGNGDFGRLLFAEKGHLSFQNLSSPVSLYGKAYTLVSGVSGIANAAATNPAGNYALAANYDASSDGTYPSAPVATTFNGIFEGLGNAISGLSISSRGAKGGTNVGLFAATEYGGSNVSNISDIVLKHARISATGNNKNVGALVGSNGGNVAQSHIDAIVRGGKNSSIGGLVGYNSGSIFDSYATGKVSGHGDVGGLAGFNDGGISESFSAADVFGGPDVGGLAGYNWPAIWNCYATGNVTGDSSSVAVGGLVGFSDQSVISSYSTGYVTGAPGAYVGGFVGDDVSQGQIAYGYWDTTTSGISNLEQGAGNTPNDKGIAGLTTAQLQSALPTGFILLTWGQEPDINGGLPYLLNNPPPKK
jgi:hypothetical protein